jgi:hypothetical protein
MEHAASKHSPKSLGGPEFAFGHQLKFHQGNVERLRAREPEAGALARTDDVAVCSGELRTPVLMVPSAAAADVHVLPCSRPQPRISTAGAWGHPDLPI